MTQLKIPLLVALATLMGFLQGCATSNPDTLSLNAFQPSGGNPNPCVDFRMSAPEQSLVGTGLTATMSAENICDEEITLQLGGATIHHDLLVLDQNGAVLWQSLYGVNRVLTLVPERLTPGESLTFEATWPGLNNSGQAVPAGAYRLAGILYSVDESESDIYEPNKQNFEAVQALSVVP